MRKIILILSIFIYGIFQTQVQAQEQEQLPAIKYAVAIEGGFQAGLHYFGEEYTVVNGFRINDKHVVGLGIGVGFKFVDFNLYCPMYANYRYYFKLGDFSPHINIALGGMTTTDGGGIYSTLTTGVRSNKFTFSSGIFFQAYQYKESYYEVIYDPYGYYSQHVEGYKTTNEFPWGFIVKLGVAF